MKTSKNQCAECLQCRKCKKIYTDPAMIEFIKQHTMCIPCDHQMDDVPPEEPALHDGDGGDQ